MTKSQRSLADVYLTFKTNKLTEDEYQAYIALLEAIPEDEFSKDRRGFFVYEKTYYQIIDNRKVKAKSGNPTDDNESDDVWVP